MKHNKKLEKLFEFTCTILSLAAVAAINYSIIHNSFIFIILFVLLAHELGHYFAAKHNKLKPKLPIFLPLPFLFIAATKIQKANKSATKQIAISGPLAGILTTLLLMLLTTIFQISFLPIIPLAIMLMTEIIFNYLGSDGKRYRNV